MNPLTLLSTLCLAAAGFVVALPLMEYWDKFSEKYLGELYSSSRMLGLDVSMYTLYLRLWGVALLFIFLFFGVVLWVWPIMLALLYLAFMAPRLIMEVLVTRRKKLLRDQMVPAISVIANGVKAGLTIEKSFEDATPSIPFPLNKEFSQILKDIKFGRPFIRAVNSAKERLTIPSFTLFATALAVSRERGGNISDVLERLRESLVETQRLERKLEADTATGNMVILVLTLVPFIFTVLMLFLHPVGTMLFFTSLIGQVLFAVVILMTYCGNRLGHRIMKIEF